MHYFWSRVDAGGHLCWQWLGSCTAAGYGQLNRKGIYHYAHRLAYQLATGTRPGKKHVLHSCDNPRCCNPMHLRLGTHAENMRDIDRHGRRALGEHANSSKLKPDDVRRIRQLKQQGMRITHIAREYDVVFETVRRVVDHETWKHI